MGNLLLLFLGIILNFAALYVTYISIEKDLNTFRIQLALLTIGSLFEIIWFLNLIMK